MLDSELSLKEKGLLITVISDPGISYRTIKNMSEDGMSAIESGFRSLIEKGYIKQVQRPGKESKRRIYIKQGGEFVCVKENE